MPARRRAAVPVTLAEHAAHVADTLKAVERATRRHHRALQAMLEEHGPGLIGEGEVVALGGGTPKTPPPDED